MVALPLTTGGTHVEGVGIRVDTNTLQLAQDGAPHHLTDLHVVLGKLHVGPHLGTGVAKPHGMDVAGIDKGVVIAFAVGIMYGSVKCVRETVLEHPCQVRRVLQKFLHFGNLLLNRV